MTDSGEAATNRADLFERGWRQGAVFCIPDRTMQALVNVKGEEGVKLRKIGRKERLLLITHDCDIAQPNYRNLEALICCQFDPSKPKGQIQIERLGPIAPRSFVVSREMGLIAETHYRVLFDRGLLEDLDGPEYRIEDEEDLRRLREWLAMRYARAAILDRTHDLVFTPLVDIFRSIQATNPTTFQRIQELVHQVRVHVENETAPILAVGLLVVTRDLGEQLTDEHVECLGTLIQTMRSFLDTQDGISLLGIETVLYEDLRYIDVLRTKALSTDWASFDENWNLTGAPPLQLSERNPLPETF